MQIKKSLKALDIKISKMAAELGVSRPTLDAYIECYENGQQIPNEGYQKIFEYLFSGDEINSVEFAQRYDYVKRVMLADAQSGAEKLIAAQQQEAILKNVKDIINSDTLEMPLINFINLFITNKDKELVRAIYLYFNYTNGYMNIDESKIDDKNKALFSQLAKIFTDYQSDTIEFLEKYYEQMVDKNKAIFEKKKVRIKDSDIVEYIKKNLGDSSTLDLDLLKQMIESRGEN